ncbi:MAG: hypothetical protein Q8O64_16260 [Sideroxyarcus sp.]|nr:hypothetical protein [Sideroxyarcus sp.]
MPTFDNRHILRCIPACSLLLLIGCVVSLPASGEEQAEAATEAATEAQIPQTPRSDTFDFLEGTRDYLSGKFTRFASYIDSYFGGNPHYQESNPSVLQMTLSRPTGYGGTDSFDLAARVDLRLPISEGKLRLLIETDPEQNMEDQVVKSTNTVQKRPLLPKEVGVAARFAVTEIDNWSYRTDIGIKMPLPPRPFVRSKVAYSVPMKDWKFTAAESVYWFSNLGVGETTQLDLERTFDSPLLFRSTSSATWLKDTGSFDFIQSFSFYQTVNDRTALLYQVNAFGVSQPKTQMDDFVLLFLYRYRLHQKWLFFEMSPELHFPKDMQYQVSPAFTLRLELLLDDKR